MSGTSTAALLAAAIARNGIALRQKRHGIWHEVTWRTLDGEADRLAAGLLSAGFPPGTPIALVADPSREWIVALLGLWRAGLRPVAVPPDLPGEAIGDILRATRAAGAICDSREALARILATDPDAHLLRLIVVVDAAAARERRLAHVLPLDSLAMPTGQTSPAPPDPTLLIGTGRASIGETTPAALLARAVTLRDRFGLTQADNSLAVLPLAGEDALAVALFVPLLTGGVTDFGESVRTLGDDLRQSEPTLLVGPARLWQKLHRDVALAAERAHGLRRHALGRLLSGAALDPPTRHLVAAPLRRRLGLRRLRVAISAAGISAAGTERFLRRLGIVLHDDAPPIGPADHQERGLRERLFIRHAIARRAAGRTTALIQADAPLLGAWAARNGHSFTNYASLVGLQAATELLDAELRKVNAALAAELRLDAYVLAGDELTAARGELTPLLGIDPASADRLLAAGTQRTLPAS